ncbi:hypothetical protein AB0N05_27515 [Nocardia sp. NPDC051030]|uniref:hypothetical protein n=1 Tax=Nocardia sp. NPDC051030 TaxID=3155162 RepID=UPI00341D66BB
MPAEAPYWPGLNLSAVGIVSVALTLIMVGYGWGEWAVLGALTSALCLGFGIDLMVAEHRYAKQGHERVRSDPELD